MNLFWMNITCRCSSILTSEQIFLAYKKTEKLVSQNVTINFMIDWMLSPLNIVAPQYAFGSHSTVVLPPKDILNGMVNHKTIQNH